MLQLVVTSQTAIAERAQQRAVVGRHTRLDSGKRRIKRPALLRYDMHGLGGGGPDYCTRICQRLSGLAEHPTSEVELSGKLPRRDASLAGELQLEQA